MNNSNDYTYYVLFILILIGEPLIYNLNLGTQGFIMHFLTEIFYLYLLCWERLFRYVAKNRICIIFGLLLAYHVINCAAHGVAESGQKYVSFARPLLGNYILLNASCFLLLRDFRRTLVCFFIGYVAYVLLSYNVMSVDYGFEGRLTGKIHSNQLAQCAGMALLLLVYMKHGLRLSHFTMTLGSVVFIAAIIGCGSRNGFLLLIFFIASLILSNMYSTKDKIRNGLFLLIIIAIAFLGIQYLLENTVLGTRVLATEVMAKEAHLGTGTILDKLGERGYYYVTGWKNFFEHPIFGIGMWNFAPYNHYFYSLHSEYMIHLCEGGLVGFCLYASFLYLFISSIFKCLKANLNEFAIIVLLIFMAYMAVGITARELFYPQFYPPLGLCLYYIILCKLNVRLKIFRMLKFISS